MARTIWYDDESAAAIPADELHTAALAMLAARRAMRDTLPDHLLQDTAIEQLLSVYVASGSAVPVDRLLDEAAVPTHLARRWLEASVSEGLLAMRGGAVSLTTLGQARMADMISRVVQSQRKLLGWSAH